MKNSSTPRMPSFRVLVYDRRGNGGPFMRLDSHKRTETEALASARAKLYRQGISAHYYRFVAVDCKNQ